MSDGMNIPHFRFGLLPLLNSLTTSRPHRDTGNILKISALLIQRCDLVMLIGAARSANYSAGSRGLTFGVRCCISILPRLVSKGYSSKYIFISNVQTVFRQLLLMLQILKLDLYFNNFLKNPNVLLC